MSKYSEKVKKRRERLTAGHSPEPEDVYSVIPDYASRVFFRAKAGMYGMTKRKYRDVRLEISPYHYKRLLKGMSAKVLIPLSKDSAEICGEMARDVAKKANCAFWVYSTPFGGRMKVYVFKTEETHSPRQNKVGLSINLHGLTDIAKPLRRSWIPKGGL